MARSKMMFEASSMHCRRFFVLGTALVLLLVDPGRASFADYATGAVQLDRDEEQRPFSGDLVGRLPLPELEFLMIFKVHEKGGDFVLKTLRKVARPERIQCFTIYVKALNDPNMVKGDDPIKPEIVGVNCESPYWFVAGRERTDKGKIFSDGNVFAIVDALGRSDEDALMRINRTLNALASAVQGNQAVQFLCLTSKAHPDEKCKLEHPPWSNPAGR
jgi:hypothetical protein